MGERGAFLRHALPLGGGGQAREGSLAGGRCFSEMQLKRQVGCESMSTEGVTSVLSHSEI